MPAEQIPEDQTPIHDIDSHVIIIKEHLVVCWHYGM